MSTLSSMVWLRQVELTPTRALREKTPKRACLTPRTHQPQPLCTARRVLETDSFKNDGLGVSLFSFSGQSDSSDANDEPRVSYCSQDPCPFRQSAQGLQKRLLIAQWGVCFRWMGDRRKISQGRSR